MSQALEADDEGATRGDEDESARVVAVPTERSIPAEVSAAWELELLIAGAVTFALFQLPSSLDAGREWLLARFTGQGAMTVALMGYVYAKAVLYVLIVAFVTNLVARAYWVGLVGLHSVYPRGVRWDELKMGPIASELYRRRVPSLTRTIARVDNFASVIFSFAFLVVVVFALSVALFGVLGLVGWGISAALLGGRKTLLVVYALGALLVVPGMIAALIDKRRGAQIAPGSAARRRIELAMRFVTAINASTLVGPIFFTLSSNGGRRRIATIFYAVVIVAIAIGLGEGFYRLGVVRSGDPLFAPDDPDVAGVNGLHYESLRDVSSTDRTPTIQSDVIDGPYARLFVPYRDERHENAIRSACPGVTPQRRGTIHFVRPIDSMAVAERSARAVLDCIARIHAVSIDGAPVPDVDFRFYEHPRSGVAGFIAYLPMAGLAPGAHTITLAPLARLPSSTSRRPLVPTVIPFWR